SIKSQQGRCQRFYTVWAEARRLRAGFSLPPAQGGAEYVSSH
ncbi:hypothetical protein VVF07_21335, partial [Pseudomonas aeruginosa]